MKKAIGEDYFNKLELVKADLSEPESLIPAIEGVQYVIHVANPIPGSEKLTHEQFIKPVEESIKIIIDACVKNKVKRLIVTSSLASIVGDYFKKGTNDKIYTEADFAKPVNVDSYTVGKIA